MSKELDEYSKFLENPLNYFPLKKKKLNNNEVKVKIFGPNNDYIYFKMSIPLNYCVTDDTSIIYIEDISENKQFTKDLNNKNLKLHLAHNIIYIDFNTDYYYVLLEIDTLKQFNYCKTNKKLTIALLNEDKSDIVNKWTTDVNLL